MMRGIKAKAIRRAIEEQFKVGFQGEPEYSIGSRKPFLGMIVHTPGTARAIYRDVKREYTRGAFNHV